VTLLRLCTMCGRGYPQAGRSTGKCPDCQREYDRNRSRTRRATSSAVRDRDSRVWQLARAGARARDGGCAHRKRGGCRGRLSVHHIVPLERGGTNRLDNLITLCRRHHDEAERSAANRRRTLETKVAKEQDARAGERALSPS
jgi:5-methylcytosine-specific restriction endonuclease McrA